ncbi:MAG: nucleotide exchange factor GrpE [Bacteroidales bacterium]|jgi:molecular chaperone GrpE|nr:nucleotide exchange factor GrpE [Bacteroidales bacterium]
MAKTDHANEDERSMDEMKDTELELDGVENENPAELESYIEDLEQKLAESQDKYLRLSAEFDNFRKRTLREKTELIQTAGQSILKEILPVVDDFERGLDAVEKAEDTESVKEGMVLIYNKLKDFLSANGVNEIKAINESFDPESHEAVTKIPAPTKNMKGKVVDVIQKGYTLNDKIIRYPKVVVGE